MLCTCLLLLLVFSVSRGTVKAEGELGASKACGGHTLGQVNGFPACMDGEDIHLCENNYPDEYFRSFLSEEYDIDKDGLLGLDTIQGVESLVMHTSARSLDGICFFMNLEHLGVNGSINQEEGEGWWYEGELITLDLRGNPLLESLFCAGNNLSVLNVSGNPKLFRLYCDYNNLSTLDVSGNPKLIDLQCEYNNLSTLDVSGNPVLERLYCGYNNLSILDVSGNPALRILFCDCNNLVSLDISSCPHLISFHEAENYYGDLGYEEFACDGNVTIITEPLIIATCPESIAAHVGETVELSTTASGEGISYKWQFSKDDGKTWKSWDVYENSLTLKVTAVRNGYCFRCKIMDGDGHVGYSSKAKLTVLPKITAQPKAVSANVGATATFKITATGTGLKYEWQFSKDGGKTWGSWDIFENVLSVKATAVRNGYYFRCVVTDDNGTTLISNKVKLEVTAPKITAQPEAVSGYVGGSAEFTVAATGATLSCKWQFSKDGGSTWSSWGSGTTAKVPVTAARNGYYFRCVITDANGKSLTSNKAKLTVLPKITAQPKSMTEAIDKNATFSVTATGAKLSYKWQFSTDGKTWKSWGSGATITVPVVASRNGYQFRCVITDVMGNQVVSKLVKLTVLSQITRQPKAAKGSVGSQVSFTAEAVGAPKLTYRWYMSKDGGKTWNYYKLGQTLEVTASTNKNNYQFRCEITDGNNKKLTTKAVKLTVLPKITKQPASQSVNVGTEVSFTATAVGAAKLTYRWYFSDDNGANWYLYKTAQTISFKATKAKNGYLYRCEITDANGKVLTTKEVKLTVK